MKGAALGEGTPLSPLLQPLSLSCSPPLQILHNYYYRGYEDTVSYLRRLSKYEVGPFSGQGWGMGGRMEGMWVLEASRPGP